MDHRPQTMDHGLSSMVYGQELGGSGWESNPPRPATRPATGFEDQETHRDLTTPTRKDNRTRKPLQAAFRRFTVPNVGRHFENQVIKEMSFEGTFVVFCPEKQKTLSREFPTIHLAAC